MKTRKKIEKIPDFNAEIFGVLKDNLDNENIKSEKNDFLKRMLFQTIDLYTMKTRMNSGFIDDLKFVLEDFFDSFKLYEHEY